jgi:hypothetical protein
MQDKKTHTVEIIFDGLMSFWNIKTLRELAEKLGVKEGTLNAWKSRGNIARPELIVEKCPGISFEWVATGNGEMFLSQQPQPQPKTTLEQELNLYKNRVIELTEMNDLLRMLVLARDEKIVVLEEKLAALQAQAPKKKVM